MSAPTSPQSLNVALQHHQAGRLHEAEKIYKQILEQQPDHFDALHHLGIIAHQLKRNDVAVELIQRAINLNPKSPEAFNNLGNALAELQQIAQAIAAYRIAVSLNPKFALAHNNLGNALKDTGQIDVAIVHFRQAVALDPALPEAHYNLSLALLTNGDFREGWEEYEWRWKCKSLHPPRNFSQLQWDGGPLQGRTILLHTQQGFGDAIQFIRYVPMVIERGGKIVIECYPELSRLFQTMAEVVTQGQPLPPFDVHCDLLSLPRVFGTNLSNIPETVPYLRADAGESGKWRERLAEFSSVVKVGLVWAGRPTHKLYPQRVLSLAKISPLGRIPGIRFFSLQKGEPAAEAKNPPAGFGIVDWLQDLGDFADTAAFIANLDLVISVDTAVVHLAGALNKPVWTLLPFVTGFRWLLEREDSPWYPSMRLFRQPSAGDWDSVISRVADSLSRFHSL